MWIMMSESFLSIVAFKSNPPQPDMLHIRARVEGDIERVFPYAKVERTPRRDYMYRTTLPRSVVDAAISEQIARIDYGNFKDSVPDEQRHDRYMECWVAMLRLQNYKEHRRRFNRPTKRKTVAKE